MLDAGVLVRDRRPGYYAWRMAMGTHTQTGIAVAASVAAYDANRIRKHEFTRPDKEDDRVRQIEALDAQTGPVLLAYPDAPEVDAILDAVTGAVPTLDIVADTGVQHVLWDIADAASIEVITNAFERLPALYIADGHHRSAAASRVAARAAQHESGREPRVLPRRGFPAPADADPAVQPCRGGSRADGRRRPSSPRSACGSPWSALRRP